MNDIVFAAARMPEYPLSRLAYLIRCGRSTQNGASILGRSVQTGNSAALVPSSIPVARVVLISDKPLPIDKKSLFDAVPFSSTPFGSSERDFEACRLNAGERSTAKEV
jgi:hypothetical protein